MVYPGEVFERLDIFSLMDEEFESLDTVLTGLVALMVVVD